ncbi:MAG: acylphosphatase [Deltaproteobacteria bacterium]|nr:acylphosphatase [Deltaproteobacteria bacterium]
MQFHAVIRGRVQGVFFRAWTQQTARSLGLVGWVRNRSDGSVELLAQGEKDPLEELLRLCRIGPPAARVEDVKVEWSEEAAKNSEFLVERSSA